MGAKRQFKTLLDIDSNTILDDCISELRIRAQKSGLDVGTQRGLVSQLMPTISNMIERGAELAAVGAQMNLNKTLNGDGYEIRIRANFGGRPRKVNRLLSFFRSR